MGTENRSGLAIESRSSVVDFHFSWLITDGLPVKKAPMTMTDREASSKARSSMELFAVVNGPREANRCSRPWKWTVHDDVADGIMLCFISQEGYE